MQAALVDLQSKLDGEERTPLLISQEKDLNQKILIAARGEEEDLRIKSRKLWLKGGDSNMKYFHNQAKARFSFNVIKELKDKDGNKMAEHEEIKTHVLQHFRDLYQDKDETDPIAQAELLFGIPSLIMEQDNKDLSKSIMEPEIKESIWELQVDKAPGLDGFTINFYRAA